MSENSNVKCEQCGAAESHTACPVCGGRGCVSARELAEKLGLREKLDITEVTADVVVKAVDNRMLECFKEARRTERELAEKAIETERVRLAEMEQRLRELIHQQKDELTKARTTAAELEQRNKTLEEQLTRRRQQPAAVGRVAEREFAAIVGAEADFRLGPKLARNGDYEAWFRVDAGNGTMREVAQPLLVDVKKESAALTSAAMSKLVRDCRARGLAVGVLVADRIAEVHEIFGPRRIVIDGDVTILLTSLDSFCTDVRLLGPYLDSLVTARIDNNKPLMAALGGALTQISQLLIEIEAEATSVAAALEKQAENVRKNLVGKLCARVKLVVGDAQHQIADAASAVAATTNQAA